MNTRPVLPYRPPAPPAPCLPPRTAPAPAPAPALHPQDIYTLFHLHRDFKFISKTSNFLIPIIGWSMFLTGAPPGRPRGHWHWGS